jgi:hypothetical protein
VIEYTRTSKHFGRNTSRRTMWMLRECRACVSDDGTTKTRLPSVSSPYLCLWLDLNTELSHAHNRTRTLALLSAFGWLALVVIHNGNTRQIRLGRPEQNPPTAIISDVMHKSGTTSFLRRTSERELLSKAVVSQAARRACLHRDGLTWSLQAATSQSATALLNDHRRILQL